MGKRLSVGIARNNTGMTIWRYTQVIGGVTWASDLVAKKAGYSKPFTPFIDTDEGIVPVYIAQPPVYSLPFFKGAASKNLKVFLPPAAFLIVIHLKIIITN